LHEKDFIFLMRNTSMKLDFIKWIGHASFLLDVRGKNVYIDPFAIKGQLPKADVIFITHAHFDHFNEEDIRKIATDGTKFVAPSDVAKKLKGRDVLAVEPDRSYEVEGIPFRTVPAYNTEKEFHQKSNGWVGYIIDADGTSVYHAGDTDVIEEMKGIDVDVALIPIGGHYTMDLEDAIRATTMIRAKVFIPMHYKTLLGKDGSSSAEGEFKRRVKNSVLLEQLQ
jgi:L-ascorbate metabolism protein UlaG (beta-lactamase superfamily)